MEKLNFVWKVKPNDGWGCERLYLNRICVAGYSKAMSKDSTGECPYYMFVNLPSLKNPNSAGHSVVELKQWAETVVQQWFTHALEGINA